MAMPRFIRIFYCDTCGIVKRCHRHDKPKSLPRESTMSHLQKARRFFDRFSRAHTLTELFPGVEKPTTTLAYVIAAKILHPEFDASQEKYVFGDVVVVVGTAEYIETEQTYLTRGCDDYNSKIRKPPGYWAPHEIYSNSALRNHVENWKRSNSRKTSGTTISGIDFDTIETAVITSAITKAKKLAEKRQRYDLVYDNQQKAVTAIANIMGVQDG